MKKFVSKLILMIVISMVTIVLAYVLLTPYGALQLTLIFNGYASNAVLLKAKDVTGEYLKDENVKKGDIVYRLTNPPIEKATDGKLYTWKVRRHGLVYIAEYLGEY